MIILCDTCSVLMLIRIAPDMFTDSRYDCITVPEVLHEIFRTQKFKSKYPWREQFKDKFKVTSAFEDDKFRQHFSAIQILHNAGVINHRTERLFNLSRIDQRLAAYAVAHQFILNSTDDDLCDFVVQEFEAKTVTPLEIINIWLEKGLIKWNDNLQTITADWDQCNEHPQPKREAIRFRQLTGYPFAGLVSSYTSK